MPLLLSYLKHYINTKRYCLFPLVIFLFALLLRAILIYQLNNTPFADCLLVDLEYYNAWAKRIAEGDLLGSSSPFEMTPLYAYFLASIYSFITTDLIWVRTIQAVIGSAGCVLIYCISKDILNNIWAGLFAGIIAAAYGPFIFYDTMIMKPFLSSFFMISTVYLLVKCDEKRPVYYLLCGISLGCGALVRENIIVLIPVILAWTILKGSPFSKDNLKRGALFMSAIFLTIAPVTLRNGIVGKEWVLITSGGGEVFYISNNKNADGTYKPPPFVYKNPQYEHENFREQAQRITKKKMTRNESSYFWYKKGFEFIRNHPLAFISLTIKRFLLFLNYYEFPDNKNFYFQQAYTPVLKLIHFGHIVPFGVLGICVALFSFKRFGAMLIPFFSYLSSILLLFNFSRFKLPSVFFIIIFGVYSIVWLYMKVKLREKKKIFIALSLIFVVNRIAFSNIAVGNPYRELFDVSYSNMATCYEEKGNWRKAIYYYEQALKINPSSSRALAGKGGIFLRRGELDRAEEAFRAAIEKDSLSFQAHLGLGIIAMIAGDTDRAIMEYKRGLAIAPEDPLLLNNIGFALFKKGRYKEALKNHIVAINKDPNILKAYFGAAEAYEMIGDTKKALRYYTYFIKKSNDLKWIKDAEKRIEWIRIRHR